ncbi:hypothetical protein HAX54_015661 [Datura stramonium]|uniref:Uncharacterized protein n=1 Tax=Datura stramonium TaxID=4076 RepID=A0ABS8RIY0_DATST|nr:hypothetical protein [Datura stramonium]
MGNTSTNTSTQASYKAFPSSSAPPVAPQPMQTLSAARMVHVANMMARNNTKLTSLIEHLPKMIKRAIERALTPIHIKIQDLEHRFLTLEGNVDDDFEDERVETDEENFKDA